MELKIKNKISYVSVKIFGQEYKFLVDTASSDTIVLPELYEKIKSEDKVKFINSDEIMTGFGHTTRVDNYLVPIEIDEQERECSCAVCNIEALKVIEEENNISLDGILGMNDMKNAILDFKKKTMTFNLLYKYLPKK